MKRLKRAIAYSIVVSMILQSILITAIFGNEQIPIEKLTIENVDHGRGENPITGELLIKPEIDISWENPQNWSRYPEGSTVHTPNFYDIMVDNISTDEKDDDYYRAMEGSDTFNNKAFTINDENFALEPGSLYQIQVEPNHYEIVNDVNTVISPLDTATESTAEYVITDLSVELVADSNSIQVIWQDLGPADINYSIYYALGDYSGKTRQDLIDEREGQIDNINNTREDVVKFKDEVDGRNKLAYTITENISPGQVYSFIVEPTSLYYLQKNLYYNTSEPIIWVESTIASLDLFEEGEFIRLEWDLNDDHFSLGSDSGSDRYDLSHAILYEIIGGSPRSLVRFEKEAALDGVYKLETPTRETTYRIDFYFANSSAENSELIVNSEEATYVPSELMIVPSKPIVPEMMTEDIRDNWLEDRDVLAPYLVQDYVYEDDIEKILDYNVTFHVNRVEGEPLQSSINLVWEPFRRMDVSVDSASDTYGQTIIDYNVYYDIWVTDYLSDLYDDIPRTFSELQFDSTQDDNIIVNEEDNEIIGFAKEIKQFYEHDKKDIHAGLEPNKIYYIKLVAKKKTIYGDFSSEPTIVSVYIDEDGNYFAPPTIAKPPLRVLDETTDTTVSIAWEEKWYEFYSPDAEEDEPGYDWTFAKAVWVDESGKIHEGEASDGFDIYRDESELLKLQAHMSDTFGETLVYREINLGGTERTPVRYKFKAVEYEEVIEKSSDEATAISEYNQYLIDQENAALAVDNPSVFEYINAEDYGDGEKMYMREGLDPNKSYVFFLYPYRVLLTGEELPSHYPTPIVVATNPEEDIIDPNPKVPMLEAYTYSDTEIKVRWKYNSDFNYTIYYGLTENVEDGEQFVFSLPDIDDDDYPVDGEYHTIIVDDLFPDTGYYFWAKATNIDTNKPSAWSNAEFEKTDEVKNPYPPKGSGIAALSTIKPYELTESVTDDYFIIEWVLHSDDVEQDETKRVQKRYEYIMEVADNPKFIAPDLIVSSGGYNDIMPANVELLAKNLVKVSELMANRPYYIRMKTRLVVEGSETGQYIEKESTFYSNVIKIITVDSGDEYDGAVDPVYEQLPEDNYDLGYDDDTDTLIYRFRANDKTDGDRDNGVDQRLISDIINNHVYVYDVDVSSYRNKYVNKRLVEIPYSVIKAFDDYKVDLAIDAGTTRLLFNDQSFKDEVNRQRNMFGVAPTVMIGVNNISSYDVPSNQLDYPIIYNEIEVIVKSEETYKRLSYSDKVVEMAFNTDEKEALVYTTDHDGEWDKEDTYVDRNTDLLTMKTHNLGKVFVANQKNTRDTYTKKHWSDTYRDEVFDDYYVENIEGYNPDGLVPEKELINVVYALMMGETTVDMKGNITDEMKEQLYRGGIKSNVSSEYGSVLRQEAISMFVKAYEISNGKAIRPDPLFVAGANADGTISTAYKEDVAKAATVGIISDIEETRAKDHLKYGELFVLWTRF